jgi:hypothetical protein
MATKTTRKPTTTRTDAQVEADREAAKAEQAGAALLGGVTIAVNGEATTEEEQEAEAASLAEAQEADEKAARNSVEIEEVDELPSAAKLPPKRTGPSIWAQRLAAVAATKSGKARIFSCNAPATATGMAWRVRKALGKGDYNDLLGEDAPKRFTIHTSGSDIFAVEHREDESASE